MEEEPKTPRVKTVTRYSGTHYVGKKTFQRTSRETKMSSPSYKPHTNEYDESKYAKYQDNDMPKKRKSTTMYTYILKDETLGIYKIGKTTSPISRFKSLCVLNKVYPISLLSKDVEKILHARFKANRVEHPMYKGNGGTEWFKRGGTFDDFIDTVDKGVRIPYITIYSLVEHMLVTSKLLFENQSLVWEVSQMDFGYYYLGVEILILSGFLHKNPFPRPTKQAGRDVLMIKRRMSINDNALDKTVTGYVYYVGSSRDCILFKHAAGTNPVIVEFRAGNKKNMPALYLMRKEVLLE